MLTKLQRKVQIKPKNYFDIPISFRGSFQKQIRNNDTSVLCMRQAKS